MINADVVNSGKVETRFTGKNLTTVGGVGLFHRFAKKLGVEEALEHGIELPREGTRCKYRTGRVLSSLIYALVLDLNRLSDTLLLRLDNVFQKLVGFGDYPHQSTFSRFLEKFSVPLAKRVGEVNVDLTMKVRNNLEGYQWVTQDFDSYVRTVYGNQQTAKVGYNPKKQGRKSFHPLFCFIGETRDFLWGRFRPGNRYSGQGAKGFLRECLRMLAKGIRNIRARGDRSFFSGGFLGELERKEIECAIAAKLYTFSQYLLGGPDYRDIGDDIAVAESRYRGSCGMKKRQDRRQSSAGLRKSETMANSGRLWCWRSMEPCSTPRRRGG